MEKTNEVCPHCGKEVELNAELKVHICPNCRKHIVACSMCMNSAVGKPCTGNCPLEILAEELNRNLHEYQVIVPYHTNIVVSVVAENPEQAKEFAEIEASDHKYDEELLDGLQRDGNMDIIGIKEL